MRLKLILTLSIVLLVLLFPLVYAHEGHPEDFHLENVLDEKQAVNGYLQENQVIVPSQLDFVIKDGNILVNISMMDESSELFYIVIENKTVSRVEEGAPESRNYDILSDEETIIEIAESEDIASGILDAYDQEKIKIKAHGFGNKVKLFFGKIFLNVFR